MANEDDRTPPARPRRASIAELFASRPATDPSRPLGPVMPSVLSQGQQVRGGRRLSIAELALATSPSNTQMRPRAEVNEAGVDDPQANMTAGSPTNPAGRRVSFGAKAYSGHRISMSGGLGPIFDKPSSSPKSSDGFNWPDKLRDRAERASMSGPTPPQSTLQSRHRSVSVEEDVRATAPVPVPAPAPLPTPAPPPPKIVYRKLDATQERILKGEFYRD